MGFTVLLAVGLAGSLAPQPGVEPGPSAVKSLSPNHWTTREFPPFRLYFKIIGGGASLVAQWLRIRLPMQGTRI